MDKRLSEEGKTPIYFEKNGKLLGLIAVADTVKDDSKVGIEQLRNLGLKVFDSDTNFILFKGSSGLWGQGCDET